ncbi:A/G-specific adenine glycosylase [Lachnospiraceae bacterium OttesenSCG-928-E19]|nr:A/G-specific adenine glycosylase [Lachnospiraceae bacterium OttesenSCG-928-E19]
MIYERMVKGIFLERPNRFIAYVEIAGKKEVVHVKNTGRCQELLLPGVEVYVQRAENRERKTMWDLIAVQKEKRLVNMDSQVPNKVVNEWIEKGNLFSDVQLIKSEVTYGDSRFDLYVECENRKIFIEVKGVTLESENVVSFPDAPSERAVKHVKGLMEAVKKGYETYVFFVVQMKGALYFTPNKVMHPDFSDALQEAKKAGVNIVAYECNVKPERIEIAKEVPVVLYEPTLYEIKKPLLKWYRDNGRKLPWRENVSAYHTWVSEIMLQQTRVEAVKPYYARFLNQLPTIRDLAQAKEDELLKLWEGLGYYNRVRNMQKAAIQIMEEYSGEFPHSYIEIRKLKGIGNYTAGAISSIAFGEPKPAVDGNVLRVVSRLLARDDDIAKASVRSKIEEAVEEAIPSDAPGDFNQALIEIGALVCLPNGAPKCIECPISRFCRAKAEGREHELPVKTKAKARKIQERTILIFKDGEKLAIRKREKTGLLAGLYEFPNVSGWLSMAEVKKHSKDIGLMPIRVQKLPEAKHIFSHIEWRMKGYLIRVDELEKADKQDFLFIEPREIEKTYPIPSAFEAYMKYVNAK